MIVGKLVDLYRYKGIAKNIDTAIIIKEVNKSIEYRFICYTPSNHYIIKKILQENTFLQD